jgi:hypothetical protein
MTGALRRIHLSVGYGRQKGVEKRKKAEFPTNLKEMRGATYGVGEGLKSQQQTHRMQVINQHARPQQRVNSIKNAAVAGDEVA